MLGLLVALWLPVPTAVAALAPAGGAEARVDITDPHFESVGGGEIPREVVATLAQDGAGYLWVATGDGLVRYDGYRFRPWERDSADPTQRNLGWVRALLGARDGRLYIATESQGLAVYDPRTERITDVPLGLGSDDGARPAILALAEDGEGAVWLGTVGAGLVRYEPATGRSTRLAHTGQPGSLPDDRVRALRVDRQGTLWVGTWRGLSRRLPASRRFEPIACTGAAGDATQLGDQAVQALFQASDGRLWAGTAQGRIAIVDPDSGRCRLLGRSDGLGADDEAAVTSFTEGPDGRVWVGRTSGIDLHDLASGRLLRRLRHDPRRPLGLAANEVTTLLRDRAGLIWVGGYGLGLQRHDPNDIAVRLREADLRPGSPLADADVRSLLQADDGRIWAATHGGCVAWLDTGLQATGALCPSLTRADGRAAAGERPWPVQAMAQGRDGAVWLGGEAALLEIGRDGRRRRLLYHHAGATNHLLVASDGTLWVGTEDGLYRLRPGAAGLERVAQADGRPLAGDVFVTAQAADGALWVASARGLFRVPAGADALQPVQSPPGQGLGNPTVIGLLFDRQHTLWVDVAVTGLHHLTAWDGRSATFDAVSVRHGVTGRPFGVNLLEDARGRIWSQLNVYDPARDQLDELGPADGVRFGTGWFRAYAQLGDGRMLFGGSRGLLVVQAERYDRSAYRPPLEITGLRIDGRPVPAGRLARGLHIEPGQRSFSLDFAALDYSDPGRIRYAWRLDGYDRDWVHAGADQRHASYGNLDPGRYVWRLRATNRSGVWSPRELAVAVQVMPAWWQRSSFKIALAALLLILPAAFVQWRTRRLRQSRRELEAQVRLRTAELEATTQALQRESTALAEASLTDPLTGLRNRRFLAQHIERETAAVVQRYAGTGQHPAAPLDGADLVFFLVDIDEFKQVNDLHGHAAGDAVIAQMRARLGEVFRDSDYLVRWGGEEFLVVARHASRRHAPELAERARAAVADRPFELGDGRPLSRTCSVGFCCFPVAPSEPGALDWSETVRLADAALYAVKHHGRNGWLGVVAARADSASALRAAARGPLAAWAGSGALELAGSAALRAWP
ncbi:MAG: diguanylate cyclase, partial [Burkholderiales bacterium]|nr:diguanylate cyclase [Burkholderiales bacterium]